MPSETDATHAFFALRISSVTAHCIGASAHQAAQRCQHPPHHAAGFIAGDVVILHLLHRLGLLQPKNGGKPPVEVW